MIIVTFMVSVLVIGTASTVTAPAAWADTAQYGPGFRYGDRGSVSFLGTFRVDGVNAYCFDAVTPPAHAAGYHSRTTVVGTGELDRHAEARLATLLRLYGDTNDDVTAAAVNLNVWTWLRGAPRSASWYAARAGSRAHDVLATAAAQRGEVDAQAALETTARSSIVLADDAATGTVTTDLRITRLHGETDVVPGSHVAKVKISGATFVDGTTESLLANGVATQIVPDRTNAVVQVTAETVFDGLPDPRAVSLFAPENPRGQRLVRASDTHTIARATAATSPRPSPLPWQPVVTTATSLARDTKPGTVVHDTITVDAAQAQPGTLGVWAVDSSLVPQSIEVVSELLGPFLGAELTLTSEWPLDATRVCTVTTVVSTPGRYTTTPCTIPSPGRYAWVESISASDRRLPWRSPFGVPSEVLIAEWAPTITTEATTNHVRGSDACVADTLHVTNLNPSARAGLHVTVDLLGPLPNKPVMADESPGTNTTPHHLHDEVSTHRVASATMPVTADGTFVTPCLALPPHRVGYYYFVWHHSGSPPDESGYQIIPPASDLRPHEKETILYTLAEPALAETGNDVPETIKWASIILGIGLASLGLTYWVRRRQR